MSSLTDRQYQEANLKLIIENAMQSGKTGEAVKAIQTLATMKGWSKGDAPKDKRVLVLNLDDSPDVMREAMGVQPVRPEKLELYKRLGEFYVKNYGKKDQSAR